MVRVRKRGLPDGRACYDLNGDAGGIRTANRYLLYLANLDRSPNTIRAYATDLRLWIGWLADLSRPWESADLELLGQFVYWLRTTRSGQRQPDEIVTQLTSAQPGRSPKTVNRIVGTVFAFYEFHAEAGAPISRQLVDFRATHHDYKRSLGRRSSRRRPITLPEPSTRPATLSAAQVGNLVRACEHRRDRLLIGFWWLAGLRVGQTLGLRHDDIDARKGQLRIVPRVNPNGARPKVRETQTVPLRPELVELRARRAAVGRIRLRLRQPVVRAAGIAHELLGRRRPGPSTPDSLRCGLHPSSAASHLRHRPAPRGRVAGGHQPPADPPLNLHHQRPLPTP